MQMADNQKLSLQAFLQILTSKSLPMSRAMTVASKIYKDFNTPARLGELTDSKLLSLGVSDKEDRRLVLSALKNAGYRAIAITNAKQQQEAKKRGASAATATNDNPEAAEDEDVNGGSSAPRSKSGGSSTPPQPKQTKRELPSSPTLIPLASPPPQSSPSPQKKRKRGGATAAPSSSSLENEYLAGPADADEGVALGSLDFHEILDEDALELKSTVVNRAPVMMAWACVIAERLGFSREEALSIASVYTGMNAVSKGVSLGIYDKKREATINIAQAGEGAQPYVDLLGRRVPLYRTASGSWRAFTTEDSSGNSTPGGGGAAPGAAFSYITRALRQTAPAVLGAMHLLAESYDDPMELNRMGFTLYAGFRPDVDGWGARGVLKCETILGMRKGRKGGSELSRSTIGAGTTKIEGNGQVVMKPEDPDTKSAHSVLVPDGAQDVDSAGKQLKLEADELFDTSFDDFTAEELSILP